MLGQCTERVFLTQAGEGDPERVSVARDRGLYVSRSPIPTARRSAQPLTGPVAASVGDVPDAALEAAGGMYKAGGVDDQRDLLVAVV